MPSIEDLIGPPPPRPPNVYLSDGTRNPERDKWFDELGPEEAERQAQAWRDWFNKEQEILSMAFSDNRDERSREEILGSFGYSDERGKGSTVFSRYSQEEIDRLRREAFLRSKGQYTLDPETGLYFDTGPGAVDPNSSNWKWYDSKGNPITPDRRITDRYSAGERAKSAFGLPAGASPTAPTGSGGASSSYRPYLNLDDSSFYRGYRDNYLRRPTDRSKASAYSDYEINNRAFGLDPLTGIPGLTSNRRISGLDNAFGLPEGY